MSTWKDRGYVPDSDGEEELVFGEGGRSPVVVNDHGHDNDEEHDDVGEEERKEKEEEEEEEEEIVDIANSGQVEEGRESSPDLSESNQQDGASSTDDLAVIEYEFVEEDAVMEDMPSQELGVPVEQPLSTDESDHVRVVIHVARKPRMEAEPEEELLQASTEPTSVEGDAASLDNAAMSDALSGDDQGKETSNMFSESSQGKDNSPQLDEDEHLMQKGRLPKIRTYSHKFKSSANRKTDTGPDLSRQESPGQAVTTSGEPPTAPTPDVDIYSIPSSGTPQLPELPVATDILTHSTPGTEIQQKVDSDSELSDVDMEIVASSPHDLFDFPSSNAARSSKQTTTLVGVQQEPSNVSPAIDGVLSTAHSCNSPSTDRPGGNWGFRSRRAIQLNPFQLEKAKYMRTAEAHGFKPFRAPTTDRRAPRKTNDTQSQEYHDEYSLNTSRTQETTPPDSSASSHQPTATPQRPRLPLMRLEDSSDEDFPDTAVAQQRHVDGGVQQGYKRRKTIETPAGHRQIQGLPSSTASARGKLRSLGLISRSTSLSGVPLSPPTTSPSNTDHLPSVVKFRRPHGTTPPRTETPLPSSPPRRVELLTLSDSEEDAQPGNDEASERSASPVPDPEAEARRLQQMVKRVRGVLPASWVKLDQKTNRKISTSAPNHHLGGTPRPTGPVRGVAQRVTSTTSNTPAGKGPSIVLSDDSDGSDGSLRELPATQIANMRARSPQQRHLKSFDDTAEVEEYDEIDHMLPTAQQSRIKKGKSKKQQSRLTDGFVHFEDDISQHGHARSGPTSNSHGTRHAASARQSKTKSRSKVRRKAPVQLSILDAPKEPASSGRPEPQFLRVAARQARRKQNLGRHSPNQKNIRLATHEDTEEALMPLQSWNAGNINPSSHVDLTADDVDESPGRASLSTSRTIRRVLQQTRLQPEHQRPISEFNGGQLQDVDQPRPRAARRALPRQQGRMRPAQLETVARQPGGTRDFLTFAPEPSVLMEIFQRGRGEGAPSRLRLERFLQDRGDMETEPSEPNGDDTIMADDPVSHLPVANRSRKRLARRMDVDLRTFRQPSEPLPMEGPSDVVESAPCSTDKEVLQGLGPYGTRYPTDFDVRPLDIGTYFHQSTFIGSGDFANGLTLKERDLDLPASRIGIDLGGESLHWSAWDEEVSSGLAAVLNTCSEGLQALVDAPNSSERQKLFIDVSTCIRYLLQSLVRYCSGCLYFIDPVDRLACVSRLSRFLDDFHDILQEHTVKLKTFPEISVRAGPFFTDLLLFISCISAQTARIAQHPAVNATTQTDLADRTVRFSRKAIASSLPGLFTVIRVFLEDHRQHAKREAGIRDDQIAVKCVVMVNHILQSIPTPQKLSDILLDELHGAIDTSCHIQTLDRVWYDIFTVQPLLEFDARGIYRPGSRFQASNEGCNLVKRLLQRLFHLYPASAQSRSPTLNDYVRASLTRAYYLIARWSWRRCEVVISTVYDFFASNGLAQLQNEESKGSPQFLEELDKDPAIQVESSDSAFNIFLKLLVVGLQGMQAVYPERQVCGFAWRFIPNHGRTYKKDQEITQAALNALRNNHDLLCTLYWVLPQGGGPRVRNIKDLVDHTTSHREACRLSVHAWAIIAKYQLSRSEQFKDLDSLALWFKDMASTTISQYRLARPEAEMQYAAARATGSTDITQDAVERTISNNQRGIFATLLDLLQALRQAIKISKSWEAGRNLVDLANLTDVFKFFDPDQPRLFAAIAQALDIVQELHRKGLETQTVDSQHSSEESQDYGDWSYLEEAADVQIVCPSGSDHTQLAFLHEPLAGLVSSCFGSDTPPDDDLLKKTVTVWTTVALEHVKHKVHDWSSYLDTYSTNSWFQLRNTDQTRKYTSYFLSAVIEVDGSAVQEHRSLFLSIWLVHLLERESMLKFQHLLTNSLLNALPDDRLLHNLPFAAGRNGRFTITLAELRERRTSLIDCILSNMHENIHGVSAFRSSSDMNLKREYVEMLKQAMAFMRKNYEELQEVATAASDTRTFVQGAYVSFVQHVISLMQQYTVDICPIDKFFVDSSVFPLPSNDPTYVVGRLKSYVFKLGESKTRKQLAVFMQTVSERAAVDNEQAYLVGQLHQAMTGKATDSLRSVLMTAIFPAYLEAAASTSCGWILALPLVEATALVFEDLIYDLEPSNESHLSLTTVTTVLDMLFRFVVRVVEDTSLLAHPQNLRLLNASFRAVQSSFTIVDYVSRRFGQAQAASKIVQIFVKSGAYLQQVLCVGQDEAIPPDTDKVPLAGPQQFPDTLTFSKKGLLDEMNRCWVKRGDEYAVVRGSNTREVVVNIGLVEEERDEAKVAIGDFMAAYKVVFGRTVNVETPDMFAEVFI